MKGNLQERPCQNLNSAFLSKLLFGYEHFLIYRTRLKNTASMVLNKKKKKEIKRMRKNCKFYKHSKLAWFVNLIYDLNWKDVKFSSCASHFRNYS